MVQKYFKPALPNVHLFNGTTVCGCWERIAGSESEMMVGHRLLSTVIVVVYCWYMLLLMWWMFWIRWAGYVERKMISAYTVMVLAPHERRCVSMNSKLIRIVERPVWSTGQQDRFFTSPSAVRDRPFATQNCHVPHESVTRSRLPVGSGIARFFWPPGQAVTVAFRDRNYKLEKFYSCVLNFLLFLSII